MKYMKIKILEENERLMCPYCGHNNFTKNEKPIKL